MLLLYPNSTSQEYSNISSSRVESMERRLKGDVLAEARENSGRVLVTRERIGEDSARVINEEWEECDVSDPKSVLTPADIFRHLQDEGYPVEYARIPVTDGKAPQLSDIDDIVSQAALADENAALVFSCQGGAGRTTTGMVVGSLLHLRRQRKLTALPTSLLSRLARRRSSNAALGDSSDYEVFDVLRDHAYGEEGDDGAGTSGDEVAEADAVLASIEASLKGGSYAAIQKLCHLLKYGDEAKEVTDVVIDTCGKLKNLRKAIFAYRKPRKKWGHSWGRGDESLQGKSAAFKNGIEYLERYFVLIAFASWLDSDDYRQGRGSFYEWFDGRSDLKELMKTIRTNPGAALSATLPTVKSQKSIDVHVVLGQDHKTCMGSRCGSMLRRNTILKSYLFPEMQIETLGSVSGVCNFLQAEGVPVASAAAPSVDGMRSLLTKFEEEDPGHHVVIIDLREELVVYVKGVPYVLREVDFATKSLNLAGMSTEKVLEREAMLKGDLLEECHMYQGRVLLHHEVSTNAMERVPSKGQGLELTGSLERGISRDASKAFDVRADAQRRYLRLEAFWETLDASVEGGGEEGGSPDEGVCTTSEMTDRLRAEGFAMSYFRFPWSRERSPTARDMDSLHSKVTAYHALHGGKLRFLFLSHTGIGMGVRNVPVLVSCFYRVREDLDFEPPAAQEEAEGDNRMILALTRVIPEGPRCKAVVDGCIQLFSAIGDIRRDIERCKDMSDAYTREEKSQLDKSFIATRLLGLNYLQRYFFSICYVCYLRSEASAPFSDWFGERKELKHLLDSLAL